MPPPLELVMPPTQRIATDLVRHTFFMYRVVGPLGTAIGGALVRNYTREDQFHIVVRVLAAYGIRNKAESFRAHVRYVAVGVQRCSSFLVRLVRGMWTTERASGRRKRG